MVREHGSREREHIQRGFAVRKRDNGTITWAKVRGGRQEVVHSKRHERTPTNKDEALPVSTLTLGRCVRQEVAWQNETKEREKLSCRIMKKDAFLEKRIHSRRFMSVIYILQSFQ